MTAWKAAAIIITGLMIGAPAHACGSSKPPSSADILKFQIDIIDRGLKREKLSDDDRAKVVLLRSKVEESQISGRREEAREAVVAIVSMFSFQEFGGAAEPLVLKCARPVR